MREAIGIGETIEIATQKALAELNVEEAEIEVLELPEKKLFGLFGGKQAKVRAFVEDKPEDVAVQYLINVLKGMGAEKIEVTSEMTSDGQVIKVEGEDSRMAIGHHGETLEALQYLVGMAANRVCEKYCRVTINVGDYREKREGTLGELAKRIAKKAIANNRRYSLEPMNPYERRIIHTAVQEIEGATSWSEGSDLDRHVVIGPEGFSGGNRQSRGGKRPQSRSGYNRGGKRNGGKGGNNANRGERKAPRNAETKNVAEIAEVKAPVIKDAPVLGNKKEKESVPLYGRIN